MLTPSVRRTLVACLVAAAAFGLLYWVGDRSISLGGIAAASVLAVGISRAMAARARKTESGATEHGR